VGESVALLLSEAVPLNVPIAVGAKVTLKEVLWPALSVSGKLRSPSLKPVPEMLALEIVTAAVPVLVMITENTVLCPTSVLPKFSLFGLSARVIVTPVPARRSVLSESVALPLSETVPLKVPVVVGAKVTLKEVTWPTFSVTGRLRSLSLKAVPETLALEMVTAVAPMLKIITGRIEVWPTTVLPNFRLVGVRVSATPVPVSEIVLEAGLLVMSETLPLNVPVAVDVKLIVKRTDKPGLIVSGSDKPLTLNQVPITFTPVRVQSNE
jgi:hypothetical protein